MELVALGVIAAFVPALLWLTLFYSRDRYEREPKRLIGKLFGAGVLSVIPALVISLVVQAVLSGATDAVSLALIGAVLVAPIVEEPTKAAFGQWLSRNEADFDEPVDGMIYFTTVGLGFGAIETAMYIIGTYFEVLNLPGVIPDPEAATGAAAGLAVLRGLTSTMAHGVWTGLVGYFIARRRFDRGAASPWIGLGLAAVAHGLWNAFAPTDLGIGIGILVLTGIVYFVLFERAIDVSPHRLVALAAAGQPVSAAIAPPALPVAPPVPAPATPAASAPASVVAAASTATGSPSAASPDGRRPCPVCGESIVATARMCRFCRTRFPQAAEAPADG